MRRFYGKIQLLLAQCMYVQKDKCRHIYFHILMDPILSDFVGEMASCNFISEQIVKVTQIYTCLIAFRLRTSTPGLHL